MIFTFLANFLASLSQADEICIACTGKAFSAISAAFSTQGYYLQADIIEQIFYNGMGSWAMLAYIASACGGLVGVATGQSPKNYMWYFMGPALYHWLVGTTYLTHGVSWAVGGDLRDQREVWKITKTGLETSNYAVRYAINVDPIQGPSYPAEVADFFAWYDDVVSDTVQQLVSWLAVPYMNNQFGGESITRADVISDSKWRYLQDIVGARFSNPGLQVAFTYFLEGSCGQILRRYIDNASFAQAVSQEGRNLTANFSFFQPPISFGSAPYSDVIQGLATKTVSSRQLNRQVFSDPTFMQESTLAVYLPVLEQFPGKNLSTRIDCNDYLLVLMQAFRWEAGRIYMEMIKSLPAGVSEDQFVAQLFHGWEIPLTVGPTGAQQFMINLILAHLIGNEFKLAPRSFAIPNYNAGERVIKEFIPNSQRLTQPQSKFSELYVWALMVPYFQGLLLFMLAVAYPFACMLVVMPGFHKVMFTWASMYLWVKLWDFGFAMVQLIDRGVWSTLGNTANAQGVNNVVESLSGLHTVSTVIVPATPFTAATGTVVTPILTNYDSYLQILDLGMQLAFNVDYSLANSYYIYIMSALYFAVPVVLGQLVLSGKGWIADMARGALGTMAGDVKGGAQSAAVDALTRASKQQFDAQRVAAKMASGDTASFMARALGGRNESELAKMEGAYRKMGAQQQQQALQADQYRVSGIKEQLGATGNMVRAAGSDLGAQKEGLSAEQANLGATKFSADQLAKGVEFAKGIISAREKEYKQRQLATETLASLFDYTGDLKKFADGYRDNLNNRRNAIADKANLKSVANSDLRDPATGEEFVQTVGNQSSEPGSSGGGMVSGTSSGQGGGAFEGKAKDIFGERMKLGLGVASLANAAAQASQGRVGPLLATATLGFDIDSNVVEGTARAIRIQSGENLAQQERAILESGRRADIYGAKLSQFGSTAAGIESGMSAMSAEIARQQAALTRAQVPLEQAQAQVGLASAYLSDTESRAILGMQVDAANFGMQRDYSATRLGNQAGIDEAQASFSSDLDVSYATQLGGASVGGVLSAGGVVAGSFSGSSMSDNLKTLAFADTLDDERGGLQAAQAGKYFEVGGVFDSIQTRLQGSLLTGDEVQQGRGGAASGLVGNAQDTAQVAIIAGGFTAAQVSSVVSNMDVSQFNGEISSLRAGVSGMPNPGVVLDGAPKPLIVDAVQTLGVSSSKEMLGPLQMMVNAASVLPGGGSPGISEGIGKLGDMVGQAVDKTFRPPDEIDHLQENVTGNLQAKK